MQSGSGRQSCNSGMAAAAAVAHVGFSGCVWGAVGGEAWQLKRRRVEATQKQNKKIKYFAF